MTRPPSVPRVRTLAVTAALTVGLASMAIAQAVPRVHHQKYTLPNGLDVILHEDHSIPVVAVNVWYHVGSKDERPGRTGFAHLFEHMMFQGSEHHDAEYFAPLEKAGASINGSTTHDRTNYYEDIPSNYLELALWLESDRMGFLLPAMTRQKLDNQRDVVKNERRQSYENQPYGRANEVLLELLYPEGHPYSWPVIGSMEDLSAASMEDVSEFFRKYYAPNNASLAIAGDFDSNEARRLVEKYFGSIPAGPAIERLTTWPVELDAPKRKVVQDDVRLPRVYHAWHTPAFFEPGDAEFDLLASILADGKDSRLYKSLVYEKQIAQDVRAYQASRELGSTFHVIATAREGHTLGELEAAIDAELRKVVEQGVTDAELQQAKAGWEARFVRQLETVGGFGGVADRLNMYNVYLGDPGNFEFDLNRYRNATAKGVQEYARRHLGAEKRVTVRFVPRIEPGTQVASEVDRSEPPAAGPDPIFEPPELEHTQLAGGLEVYVVEDHSLPLVQASLVIKSGWGRDPEGLPGVASLTAELLDEGTKNRTALQISAEAKRLGAELNTGSFFDGSLVGLNVLRQHLDEGLALMADIAMNPTFPTEELERQRQLYLGRIQQQQKQPVFVAFSTFLEQLYGEGHPYAQPYTGTGTVESVQSIQRQHLTDYYESNYNVNNAALVFVGDIEFGEAVRKAEDAFGAWKPGPMLGHEVPTPEPITQTQLYVVDKPGAAQSVIAMGKLGVARNDPDYLPFQVMNNAFGGQFGSRINLNLREDKGYSYGAGSFLLPTRGVGPFIVYAPVQTQSTKEALAELLKETRELVGPRPLTPQEVEDSKSNLIKSFPQEFEELSGVAGEVGSIVRFDLPNDEWETYVARLQSIGADAAQSVAEEHIDPNALLIVVVGDREKIEPGLRELGLGEVKTLAAKE